MKKNILFSFLKSFSSVISFIKFCFKFSFSCLSFIFFIIEKLKGNIAKVKIAEGSLSDEQRKKFAIWSKLIENL